MVCGRFFACSALLLFGVSLHDVEASGCPHIIHKKDGETVELSSCFPGEGVIMAQWIYKNLVIADKDRSITYKQFEGRLYLNPTNFSLTVRGLTLQDSGNFSFVSTTVNGQRTIYITLQVHETITKQPHLTANSAWHNNSCTVFLECYATTDSSVTYKWTVRNHTRSGSTIQYMIRAQDGDTEFTCTVYNFFSQMSASELVTCSSDQEAVSSTVVPLIAALVIGILLIILLLLVLYYTRASGLCCGRITQSHMVNQGETQEQVYSSLVPGDVCIYETIRQSENAGTGDDCIYESIEGSEEAEEGPRGKPQSQGNKR